MHVRKTNQQLRPLSTVSTSGVTGQVPLLPTHGEGIVKIKTVNFLWAVTKANFAYFMAGTALRLIYVLLLFVAPQLLE